MFRFLICEVKFSLPVSHQLWWILLHAVSECMNNSYNILGEIFPVFSNGSGRELYLGNSTCERIFPFSVLSSIQSFQIVIISTKNKIRHIRGEESNSSCSVFKSGEVPPMRWIVNFDRDLLDGLVLAAQLAAYCPYLVRTFLNIVQVLYCLLM